MLTLKQYIQRPNLAVLAVVKKIGFLIPDRPYLKIIYRLNMGHRLDLKHPRTFTEKIQWLKLYNRKPEYTTMVDKVAAKDYVAERLGKEYVIPMLGVWERPEYIDWDALPDKFVLKTNHSGGNTGVVICKDKSTFDREKAIQKLNRSLKADVYRNLREWPYKNVPRKVFAEQYIDPAPNVKDLPDYKWFCFGGEPRFCQVIQDRNTVETIDFFDAEWNHQDFVGLNPAARPASVCPERPKDLETQVRIAREMSKNCPFSRIDLYSVSDATYFGEVTFYPASGFGKFKPTQYDEILGEMLRLPGEKMGGVNIRLKKNGEININQPELFDYKFFCFDGKVKCFKIDFGRQTSHHANYYDPQGHLLPFGEADYLPIPSSSLDLPTYLVQMITFAEKLSEGHSFLRVDFYEANNQVYFGEITFFPASGFGRFEPEEWDAELGGYINIDG